MTELLVGDHAEVDALLCDLSREFERGDACAVFMHELAGAVNAARELAGQDGPPDIERLPQIRKRASAVAERLIEHNRVEEQQVYLWPEALLGRAELETEKTYLMGKFARAGLGTRCVDYNGRLCMVSAAAGNNKAFGIDRAANP
jgi:hypothetical protein